MKKAVATMMVALLAVGVSLTANAENAGHLNTSPQISQNHPVYLEIDDDLRGDILQTVSISQEEAQKLALGVQPGTIREMELEMERGTLYYKIEMKNGYRKIDVYVDAMTGEAWRENDPERMKQKVKISLEEAKKLALNQVQGTITKAKLDEDDGQYLYEVEIRTDKWQEVDIEISATTGEVLDVDWDD